MREIEVKFLEVDVEGVIRKLRRLGARRVFDGLLENAYFDFPGRKLRKQGRLIRVRQKGSSCVLTCKTPLGKSKAKIMAEHEIVIGRPAARELKKILEGMGLKEYPQPSKRRISYALDRAHFEIDFYPGIPAFLEIEAASVKAIRRWATMLGFAMQDAKPWNTRDVFRHYKKRVT